MVLENSFIRDYKINKKIGEGGMGSVYLAEDTMLERKVAIKVLNPLLTSDPQFTERFRQEAKVQASLIHPNIVALHSFFEDSGNYFMAMEYAKGVTLKQLMQKIGAIPEQRAIKIFLQILEGVGYAHQKGIVHRDLKPSNIMIDENDAVKIMDFGIAKVLGDRGMTKTGTKMGTIYYMSPEQIRAAKDIDQRTDIYSLGIVLYEMLTGRVPFNTNTESDFEIMNEIVNNSFHDVRKYNPSVSEITAKVIDKMIAKQKEERYATCYQTTIKFSEGLSAYSKDNIESFKPNNLESNEQSLKRDKLPENFTHKKSNNVISRVDVIDKRTDNSRMRRQYGKASSKELVELKARLRQKKRTILLLFFFLLIIILIGQYLQ